MGHRVNRSRARSLLVAAVAGLVLAGCGGRFSHTEPPAVDRGTAAVHRHVLNGTWHFENDRIGLALAEYRTALRHDPNSVRALNGVAASYDRLHRFDLAEHYYQLALAADPGSAQTLNNLAYSHMMRGDEPAADRYLAAARSAVDTAPDPWRRTLAGNAQRLNSGAVAEAVPPTLSQTVAEAGRETGAEGEGRAAAGTVDAPRDLLAGTPIAVVEDRRARRGWIERHGEKSAILVVSRLERLEERLRGMPGGPEALSYFPQIADVGEAALVEAWDASPFLAALDAQQPVAVAEGPLPPPLRPSTVDFAARRSIEIAEGPLPAAEAPETADLSARLPDQLAEAGPSIANPEIR